MGLTKAQLCVRQFGRCEEGDDSWRTERQAHVSLPVQVRSGGDAQGPRHRGTRVDREVESRCRMRKNVCSL